MKNIFSKIAIAAAVTGMGLGVTSCDLDLKPVNVYTPDTFWSTKSEFEGNIIALSNMFRANYPKQILFDAGDVRAGSLYIGTLADGSGSDQAEYIQNLYDATHCQFNTFGNWYGFIAGLNNLIYNAEKQEGILDDNTRDGLLAMAYGWRAFSYFQMYRMYGGVPLRTEPDVSLGQYDPTKLYKPRASAEETLNLIKQDIDKSLNLFAASTYSYSSKKAYYWSKEATQMLAGQVYLWSAKVATDDHALGGAADVAKAKGYFTDVMNAGYTLMDDFYDAFSTPLNKESIYSVCYSSLSDKSFYSQPQQNFNWAYKTGAAGGKYWSVMADATWSKVPDGVANLFGRWGTVDKDGNVSIRNSVVWNKTDLGVHRYMFKNAFYFQFNLEDSRSDALFPVYELTAAEQAQNLQYIPSGFNPNDHKMMGTFVVKYRYVPVDGYDYWQTVVDMPIYRLPDAIFGLAECANYEGNGGDVAKYINMIRKRAYGENWDETKYGYTAGSFKDNEVAILQEADKEFMLEGRRWWNLRRLTTVKDGAQTDHLVFQPEGCIGWGLPVASSPWMIENDGTVCQTSTPVLQTAWEYRLLWPVDQTLLNSDPEIKQNPNY